MAPAAHMQSRIQARECAPVRPGEYLYSRLHGFSYRARYRFGFAGGLFLFWVETLYPPVTRILLKTLPRREEMDSTEVGAIKSRPAIPPEGGGIEKSFAMEQYCTE
jgi:hypothetical protein